MDETRRFALDHNFPGVFLDAFRRMMAYVELVPVSDIDPGFPDLDDWELLHELYLRHPVWDGLVTNDRNMLSLAKEMTVLDQTGLTLVVATGEGHNRVRAVGVLLCHMKHICHHTTRERAQIWELRVTQKDCDAPEAYLRRIAARHGTSVAKLHEMNKLSASQLRR